jgi:hypothetical protein
MKMKLLFAVCGMAAALICGASSVSAQDQNPGGGGPGGGGGFGGGRGGGFDPAQMQQRMMDRIRDNLNFTNDTDWNAVQPLVQKVFDAQRDVRANQMAGMRMAFRRNNNNNQDDNQRRQRFGGFFGQPSPEFTSLQDAVNNNAPDSQIKDLLSRYTASQKAREDKLKSAQDNLRAVLTVKQEAAATLMGLL